MQKSWKNIILYLILIIYVLWPVTHVFIHLAVKIYSIIIIIKPTS